MDLDIDAEGRIVVSLSERNLLALLAMLQDSERPHALIRQVAPGLFLVIRPQCDEDAYANRPAGVLSPPIEQAIETYRHHRATGGKDDN